jgi:phage gp29-like protein
MFGSSSPFTGSGNTIVRSSDDLIIQKGGNRALSVYQRLLLDEQVQGSFSKLLQEITSRPWFVEEYSEKPGDLAVRDFVAETLAELPVDEIYKGLAEAVIVGFSVGEVMWKKTRRGVIPFDVRMRDQRRFVFQEAEDSLTGFTMRCLTFNRMFEGVELPARKFIVNRHWSQHNGDPYGSGVGRLLYPLVKFRRRALESYVLYGDRFATPTAVAKAPLSASTAEIDTIYDLISNLSQETAIVLPEGFDLNFADPSGNPEVFKNLIDYLDKEISLLICGENEAGAAEAGSRASSQVANVVRIVKASELSEIVSHLLTKTLVRWIVDLNFGVDVAAPTISREFRMEESQLTVADVSLLIQNGFKPKKGWISRHFRVELEEDLKPLYPGQEDPNAEVKFDPEKDKNLYESIFGDEGEPAEEPAEGPAEGPAEETPAEPEQVPEETPAEPPTKPAEEPAEEGEPTGEILSEGDNVDQTIEDVEAEGETTPEGEGEEELLLAPEGEDDIDSILRDLG